jgi:hypothetical protein
LVSLAIHDFRGDGQLQLLEIRPSSWQLSDLAGKLIDSSQHEFGGPLAVRVGADGPELIASRSGALPLHWRSGSGRFEFARLQFTGRTDRGQDMRSNSSGIGVRGAARINDRWVPLPVSRSDSGPGQSLQPIAIGLGGATTIDFVKLLWPDGISQTELSLSPQTLHLIEENQRQAGSCPLVFVWNGQCYQFVADILGAGSIGFNLGNGEYHVPRPDECLLIQPGILRPLDDRLLIKLGEPMEEIAYFDAVRLVAYDIPPGWEMTLDERFGGAPPSPTGEPAFFCRRVLPTAAVNDRGKDVTDAISACDGRAAPLTRTDGRFVGLSDPHSVTLTFSQPLDELTKPVLVIDGWVEYAYSQTAFAAWQAGVHFDLPTIEAKDIDGRWLPIVERFGYIAGTPRQASVPLPRDRLPHGTLQLRIRTNLHVYWDRFMMIDSQDNSDVRRSELPLVAARVHDVGFPKRNLLEQRYPVYDYDDRPPLADTRHPSGFYTEFGDATELLTSTDDALAIIGPGEEIHLEFEACASEPPREWTRYFVLEAEGWCKDADPYTRDGNTVGPLPRRILGPTSQQAARRKALHHQYNDRYRADR